MSPYDGITYWLVVAPDGAEDVATVAPTGVVTAGTGLLDQWAGQPIDHLVNQARAAGCEVHQARKNLLTGRPILDGYN